MRTAVELFTGAAGGWSLGLHWAGVPVTIGCEKDDARRAAWERRWGRYAYSDVREMGRQNLEACWLLCGSPPCKDISEVNHKGGGVDGDGLFFEAIRVADEIRPRWVALENVSRLRTRGGDRVCAALEAAGFRVFDPIVVGSADAGKDHERKRAVLIAANPAGGERRPAGQPWPAPGGPAPGRGIIPGPGFRGEGVAHLGAGALGSHLRAYDGLPSGMAEFCRRAYGDAIDPIIPYIVARALIRMETEAADAHAG